MTEDVIKIYDIFTKKWWPDEIIFGDFHDQPIPTKYYDFLNDDYGNIIPDTTVYNVLLDNKGLEYTVIPNDEDIELDIIIDDAYRLISSIDPL